MTKLLFRTWILQILLSNLVSKEVKVKKSREKRNKIVSLLLTCGYLLAAASAEAKLVNQQQAQPVVGTSLQPIAPVADSQQLGASPFVWVLKGQQKPQLQPFVWTVENPKQPELQPTLQLVKDAEKPEPVPARAVVKDSKNSELQAFEQLIKSSKKSEGLFTLYRNNKTGKILLEVKRDQLNKNFLGTITMESGIGESGIYRGLPLQDFLFYFRQVNNNLQFVVRNVNFRTRVGDPEQRSIDRSFSDSVLYALPIKSIHPQSQSLLIDLSDLLLTDLPGLTSILRQSLKTSYRLDSNKSYFGEAQAFPSNMEIESVYGFSSGGTDEQTNLETLPDSRALTLKVHYSLSQLSENNGYVPRLADDRLGYFISAYQDFSTNNFQDPFVRYINRWHLEKQDPNAPLSPPKKPIVFWIENTVPLEYRDAIREGVLMWNKAFEKAGYKDAVQVQQMPDNAQWSPADVRYNTIRWFNSLDAAFALGPRRVNPLTGEILDADILVDANLVRSLKQRFSTLVEQNSQGQSLFSQLSGEQNSCSYGLPSNSFQQGDSSASQPQPSPKTTFSSELEDSDFCFGMESMQQLSMGSLALSLFQNVLPNSDQMKAYINQYLRYLIAHEVGHTLGLRHNFQGSTGLLPQDLNNTNITQRQGLTSSVMDYVPVNLAPQGIQQGDFFPGVVGTYDEWVIEYGYKPSQAKTPVAEKRFLEEIAQRAPQPGLSYATDEDTMDLDPSVNRWDISGDMLVYSQWQLDNANAMWERLDKRYPLKGDSYSEMRVLFNTILGHYLQHAAFITKYIGGQSFRRDHAGDPNGRLPFEAVSLEKQRQALATLQKYVFAKDAFNFSPQLLNQLAPSRWRHWGNPVPVMRLDYPIHDRILLLQGGVLRSLLSNDRLNRLRDIELKTPAGQALTLPELFDTLEKAVWTEVLQPDSQSVNISSLRRSLQREHLEILTNMVLRADNVPEDARTLAWYELRQLRKSLDTTLKKQGKNADTYTKAHLEETHARITKILAAQVESK